MQIGKNEIPQLFVDFLTAYNTQEALKKAALREEDREGLSSLSRKQSHILSGKKPIVVRLVL